MDTKSILHCGGFIQPLEAAAQGASMVEEQAKVSVERDPAAGLIDQE